jgi:CheY-like chemotaxis protein
MVQKEIIQKSRILIVDDQPANVLLLERVLQQGGYTNLNKANNPRQVLEFFTLYQPDLILLDLMMPHVDGYALLTQLRSRIPDNHYLPILVLTADVSPKAKQRALSLGAKDFLTKPFDAIEVLLRIYNLLETR